MLSENIQKFLKKNGMLLTQIAVLLLPFIILFFYYSTSENADMVDIPTLENVEVIKEQANEEVKTADKSEPKKSQEKPVAASTFEVDEVSRDMLDKSAKNPHEALAASGACVTSENVRTLSKQTGTISKAKNIDQFKKPLPAMITEVEYTCVDSKGAKQTKSTTMGVAVDAKANVLRCIQSNSDPAMNSEERFKHVLKIMTHHCGFKLSEHTGLATQ
jgi:hypothetical protein